MSMSSPTALFVIDIQNDFFTNPELTIPDPKRIRTAGAAILKRARAKLDSAKSKSGAADDETEMPLRIIFVQHEEDEAEGPLVRGTEPWQLVFEPREGETIVGKTTKSAFESNPNLASELRDQGVKRIAACGIQSENCVRSTTLDALKEGFEVLLLRGAHSTYDSKERKAVEIESDVETELEEAGAKVVSWEEWEV